LCPQRQNVNFTQRTPPIVNDHQLQRYARHILLDDIGIPGQQRLLDAHALLIGAGGLGSPVALYLASSGVGHITVLDDDHVELTNLQRQIAHTTARLGLAKVDSIAQAMHDLNPDVKIIAIRQRADANTLGPLVLSADIVIDCCDNFATRHAINAACVQHGRPLVSGAAIGFLGQVSVFNTPAAQGPCYACLFSPEHPAEETRCAAMGICAPLVGIIGSAMAMEALKLLAGVGLPLSGRLQMLDAKTMRWSEMQLARNAQCVVCGH
jgi:molybdopterin-synthase adenylyltransferase